MQIDEKTTRDDVLKHRELLKEEAGRLWREDFTIRRICETVVAEAVRSHDWPDPELIHRVVGDAVMTAIAMVASDKPEVNAVLRERNLHRDRILELARREMEATIGIPIYATSKGETEVFERGKTDD